MKKRVILLCGVAVLATGGVLGWQLWAPAGTPEGQPALLSVTPGNFAQVQETFNSGAAEVRVVALLSPT